MTTILLWGDRWWLPHHKLPVPFPDLSQAADQLAAAWSERNRTIRLIYQPDEFTTIPVTCPNANRATLALALAEEHPVVRHPGHVWSYEAILVSGDTFATLLHYETQPILFGLVHRLRKQGFTVTSVWPMATWLNALPPDLSPSGAMTICALHADRFCLYRQSADGGRAVRTGHDGDAVRAVSTHLASLPAHVETEFVLYVTTDDCLVEQLTERLPLDDRQILGCLSLTHALAKSVQLPPKHPAQLLPPVPFITGPRLIALVTAACLMVAAGLGVAPAQAWQSHRAAAVATAQEKQQLHTAIATLQPAATEAKQQRESQLAHAPDPLPWIQLCQTLTADMPQEIVLTRFQADRQGFVIEGGVTATFAPAQWERWQQSLNSSNVPWVLAEPPSNPPAAAFKLRGLWP